MMTRMERPTATMAFFLPRRRAIRPVAFAEEGVGPAGADGGFAEDPGQVGGCRARWSLLPFVVRRTP